jgi:hypothetical protein
VKGRGDGADTVTVARRLLILGMLVCVLRSGAIARADPTASPVLRAARREKIAGVVLSFTGLAISMTGGVFAIVNRGFSRDTPEERLRFGLSVGLAVAAAPIVTAGVTLWAHGAVRERRERARLRLSLNGLSAEF